eukprot:scaffold14004_cov78-Phaeocystis_antarctica.AAC.1
MAKSEGDLQTEEQASIRIEGSETWLPALVPVHAARGSRTSTTRAVPVVGCFVDNRFVLSWADMRCRSSTGASFPAECDGADQRNVAIQDTGAAISFVMSLYAHADLSGSKLTADGGFGDALIGLSQANAVLSDYYIIVNGSCGGDLISSTLECNAAATALGLSDKTATDYTWWSGPKHTPGCVRTSSGNLYVFGVDCSGECSSSKQCICMSTPPPPQPPSPPLPPLPPPSLSPP